MIWLWDDAGKEAEYNDLNEKCPPQAQAFEHVVPVGSTIWER